MSEAACLRALSSSALRSWRPNANASGTGTALPIWRCLLCTLPYSRKLSGKPCERKMPRHLPCNSPSSQEDRLQHRLWDGTLPQRLKTAAQNGTCREQTSTCARAHSRTLTMRSWSGWNTWPTCAQCTNLKLPSIHDGIPTASEPPSCPDLARKDSICMKSSRPSAGASGILTGKGLGEVKE